MLIVRDPTVTNNTTYVATLALLCGISCTILMLRFGGFKATFNLSSRKKRSEYYDDVPVIASTTGAYRANREEFYGNGSLSDPPKKLHPSMVQLPPSQSQGAPGLKPSKSTNHLPPSNIPSPPQFPSPSKSTNDLSKGVQPPNLPPNLAPNKKPVQQPALVGHPSKSTNDLSQGYVQPSNVPPNLAKSTPNVSMNPNGESSTNPDKAKSKKEQAKLSKDAKNQEKELKKLEKQRIEEQKKRDKLAAQEQAKLEKERKAREKKEAQQQAKEEKLRKQKEKTKKPEAKPRMNPLARGPPGPQPVPPPPPQGPPPPTQPPQYSTNTLESSISRTSGPPGYAQTNPVRNQNDNTGNTSFGKPVEEVSTWDMVSQHRQQMSRPAVSGGGMKKTVLDLEYSTNTGRDSIEA